MYGITRRDVLISGVVTFIQSLIAAVLMSAILSSISVLAAWTRSDLVFKSSLALVLIPQTLAAPLIHTLNRYKRTYSLPLDAIGLFFVPLLIPPTILFVSRFAILRVLNLQLPSDLMAALLVIGYFYLLMGLFTSFQLFIFHVERPYVRGWRQRSWKRRR